MGFIKKITEALDNADLLQLNVKTFTGNLTGTVIDDGSTWEETIDNAKKNGTLNLVASTTGRIDGDIDQFIATGASEDLVTAHKEATESARKSRQAIVDFIVGIVKKD